jgi:hypothetical protein
LLYGGEDPATVSRRIAEQWDYGPCDSLFLIGIGLGYLPIETLKQSDTPPRLIIIEPSVEVFVNAMEHDELDSLFNNRRVDLYVGNHISIPKIIGAYKDIIPLGRCSIVIHPHYDTIVGKQVFDLKKELSERIGALRDNWHTTVKHGKQMLQNTISNLPSLFAGTPMKYLRGTCTGIPAICVAAGPSLDEVLTDLKQVQRHALIIACDSAVNTLLTSGIHPHIVVTTDIFESNIDKIKPHLHKLEDAVLIYSIESNPDNVRLYLGQKRVAVSAYSKLLLMWLDPVLDLRAKLPAMTSVSHMAIFSAMALGADPIIMAGIDLAYADGKSHAVDSAFFHTPGQDQKARTTGSSGAMVRTSPQFIADKLLIEKMAAQHHGRLITTSLKGAFINGVEIRPIREVIDTVIPPRIDVADTLLSLNWKQVADMPTAIETIDSLIEQFRNFQKACSKCRRELAVTAAQPANMLTADSDKQRITAAETEFKEFLTEHRPLEHLLKEIMLADLQVIMQRQEALSAATADHRDRPTTAQRLQLLQDHYRVYEKGMEYVVDQLEGFRDYANGIAELQSKNDGGSHMDEADYYQRFHELWQAKREYEAVNGRHQDDLASHVALIRAYFVAELWNPALDAIQRCRRIHTDKSELTCLQAEIDNGIDAIFDEIKSQWMQGNMGTTRKLLNHYMMLRSDDRQARLLKRVIRELDDEFAREWAQKEKETVSKLDIQALRKKVVSNVKAKQFERSIGILEGMIAESQERCEALREQIGDIRMMQKDVKSALWHYAMALEGNPINTGLQNKISRIQQNMQNRH